MSEKYIIGIDVGTQGTKTGIFSENGKCCAIAFEKSKLHRPLAGMVEENPEDQVNTAYITIQKCMNQSGISPSVIAGIAICGQMAGIIGIGENGKAITPYDSWLDTRCSPYIAQMEEMAGDEILTKSGCAPSFNHGPKILWWKHKKPEIFKQIKAFVQPGAYIAMRFCGLTAKDAFIDNSYLHFTSFANNKLKSWDADLCERFNIDIRILPEIVSSSKIVGELTSKSAGLAGLVPGIPIIAGCGDTAASFLAAGAIEEGICVDVAGTASVFAATASSFKADVKNKILGCGQSIINDIWYSYAYINGGGMNLEWFKNEILSFYNNKIELSFEALNNLASAIKPQLDDPIFIPHLGGQACPSHSSLRGAWIDLSWSTTSPLLYRSILESVALEYCTYKNSLVLLYDNYPFKELRVTGGGEKSELWNQMKADYLGIKVVQIRQNEGAPLGAALLAGFGIGLFKNIHTVIHQWVQTKNEFYPDLEMHSFYTERHKKYLRIIQFLRNN
jgi:xylulokinase